MKKFMLVSFYLSVMMILVSLSTLLLSLWFLFNYKMSLLMK